MDDRTYRLNRLNALATLMDLLGYSVAEATTIRERLTEDQMTALRVAGCYPIRTEAKRMAFEAIRPAA